MSAWIPVTERLPDSDVSVLVHSPKEDEPVWIGYLDDSSEPALWRWAEGGVVEVTHWMELPEPEAETEKQGVLF